VEGIVGRPFDAVTIDAVRFGNRHGSAMWISASLSPRYFVCPVSNKENQLAIIEF
jgi:hypothetical protein